MRRGRSIILIGVLFASLLAAAVAAPGAAAADPKQICADLADNGRLDGNYTQQELAAAAASVQGYCTFVVIQTPPTPPPPAPCTEVAAGTPGAVQAPNGKFYVNAPNGNAEVCGPAPKQPAPCTEVAPGTPGSVVAPNGKSYVNVPNGNAEVCGPAAQGTAATPPAPPAQAAGGTLPGQKTLVQPQQKPQRQAAAPAPQPQPQAGVAGERSPLRETRTTGTLPFTGAELAIFAIVGAALIGGGLLLRVSSRQGDAL